MRDSDLEVSHQGHSMGTIGSVRLLIMEDKETDYSDFGHSGDFFYFEIYVMSGQKNLKMREAFYAVPPSQFACSFLTNSNWESLFPEPF